MTTTTRPPTWFWIAGALLLLWGLTGVGGFAADRMMTPASMAQMSDYDRHFYAARPAWSVWAYGIATVTGLLGTIALLARHRAARPLYVTSLIFVVILFGWTLAATDIIAVKGLAAAAGLPVVIALLCLVEIWLAELAIRRGWIVR